ncbi:MAG: peptidylprolyl isomerase [Thiolinea sp.]
MFGLSLITVFFMQPLLATDDWVLQDGQVHISRKAINQILSARGFAAGQPLDPKQRQALLQELFIRESLLQQQAVIPPQRLAALEQQVQDYRQTQLAKLTLDTLAAADMPDFSQRARELYEARRDEQYTVPLKLRVQLLRKQLGENAADNATVLKQLRKLRADIVTDQLDFAQAVLQYSDDPEKTLSQGDSFWFQRGQQPDAVFNAAAQLSAEQPYSELVLTQGTAYLLKFVDRQEPVQQALPKCGMPLWLSCRMNTA